MSDVVGLAQDAMILSLNKTTVETATVAKDLDNVTCDPNDKECMSRWIQAFSDCDQ